jgi:hypothetical protein
MCDEKCMVSKAELYLSMRNMHTAGDACSHSAPDLAVICGDAMSKTVIAIVNDKPYFHGM